LQLLRRLTFLRSFDSVFALHFQILVLTFHCRFWSPVSGWRPRNFFLAHSGHVDLRPPSLRIISATSTSSKFLRLLLQRRCGRPFPSV